MESEDFEVINISEMDANNTPAASDMFATETKSETAVKTTLAKVAEFVNSITGTCDSLAADQIKIVKLQNYDSNVMPKEFDVVFTNKNTYGDVINELSYPTMTVYNQNDEIIGENIPIGDSRGHYVGALCWNNGDSMSFRAMAGKACIMNSNVRQVTDSYTLYADGTTAYNKPQIDNNYVHKEDGKGLFSGEYDDLNNKPTIPENVLKYVSQSLTEDQKQQAAANIGIPDVYATIEEVTAIENKIPDQASEENQLADKDFVNSSIASNTAYFIGNFDTLEELENQTETPVTLNDYAFVKGIDSDGNLVYKRYKYTGTEWLYEYDLNNSSFTAQQWAVINSGITADKVAEIDETVRFTAQDLTSEQKVQARVNIGANTSSITMAGYSKPDAASAIAAGDSLNDAVGKLEKTFDSYDKSNEVDSKINGALANLDKLSLTTVQDANLCISNTEGLKIFKCGGVNCPNNDDGIIITFTQTYANTYYKQIWYNDTDISSFIRVGKKAPNTDIVWSAWEKFESINKVFNLTTYAYNKVHEYIKDNWNNIPIGKSNYELATNATGTANYTVCEVTKQSDTFGEVLVHSYYGDLVMINYNGVWNIQEVVTKNNLINSLAGASTLSKFPIAKASLSSYMPFKLYLLGGSNHLIIVEGTLSNWNGTVTAFVNVKSDLVSNVSYDNTNEQLVVTTSETCYLGKISIFNTDTWCSIP